MFCQNCKTQIPNGVSVCPVCGMSVVATAPQQNPQQPTFNPTAPTYNNAQQPTFTPSAQTYSNPQQPTFTPTAPTYNNPQQPTFNPTAPVYNNTAPTTKKRKMKGWVLGIIIGVVATHLIIGIVLLSLFLPAGISYTNRADAQKEEANARAFYSSAWSAFTSVASNGPVEEDALYQTTFNMFGDSSIDQSEWTIEFDESGIIAVSIPCDDGGMLRYDGSGFSGGGTNHNHGTPTADFADDDSGFLLELPTENNSVNAEAMREESNLRAFYSSACAAFTSIAVSGPVEESELYQVTFNFLGGDSTEYSQWTIEFSEQGIISVSIPCSDDGMLTYDGNCFSGGGEDHNHGE